MAGGGAVARSARDGITDHTTRLRPREQRSPEGRTYAVRRDAAHRRSRARGRGAWLGWGWPGVDLFRTQFLWSAMASSEKIAMKARMVMAVQPIRKTHVGGRSRRKASFRRRKLSVSADLHRGCTRGVYDFAVGRSNHLYSVAATTDATGSVVERYSYNAYGARTVKDAANVVLMKSAVGQDRGFTGYRFDGETGLYFARARWYSPKLGRFVSRDPSEYIDGFSLYPAYFAPNKLDSTGLATTTPISKPEGDWAITITPSDEVGVTATNNSNGVINWGFKPKGSCCVDGYFTQKLKYVIWKKGKYVSLPLAPSRPGDPTPGGIHDGIWDHEENSHPTNPDGYMNGAGGDNSDQPNGLPDKNTLQIPWPVTTGGTPVQGYKVFEVCYNCGSGETKAVKSCFTWHVEITFHGLVTPILGEP